MEELLKWIEENTISVGVGFGSRAHDANAVLVEELLDFLKRNYKSLEN